VKVVFVKKSRLLFSCSGYTKKKKKLERHKIEAKPNKEKKKEENKTNRKHREGKTRPPSAEIPEDPEW